jgi:hypothetical protein
MANNEGQATHFVPTHKANDNTKKYTYFLLKLSPLAMK